MTDKAAVIGSFVKIQTMADGTPRIILDLQCKLSDIANMGLTPGVSFALARMPAEVAKLVAQKEAAAEDDKDIETGGLPQVSYTNSKWVALRCKEPVFWGFLNYWYDKYDIDGAELITSEELAAQAVRGLCGVDTRAKLDTDDQAKERFHRLIRKPFAEYMNKIYKQ